MEKYITIQPHTKKKKIEDIQKRDIDKRKKEIFIGIIVSPPTVYLVMEI